MFSISKALDQIDIPEWLTARRRNSYLEIVSMGAGEVRLVKTGPDLEIVELTLKKDGRLTLTPAGPVTETFHILAGQLSCALPSGPRVVTNRERIVTRDLEESVILSALTDAHLLYITTQPQFHAISEKLNQLRKLALEVELKDGYTADHCDRIQTLSFATGQELGLRTDRLLLLDSSAYLHDVGKIKVPLSVLNKPGKLTPEEWEVIKKHPTFGRELLENTFMKDAGVIVEQHHERRDGSGYPHGLSGNDILVEAAIIAVADTFDAMTTDRPYRRALCREAALLELSKYAGVHYPKEVVLAFWAALDKLDKAPQAA